MAKQSEMPVAMNNVSQIGSGTEIQGDIVCNGDLRIDGTVIGNIEVKGRVVIGNSGRVEGEITCRNGDISGRMKGKIGVQELLALKATSTFEGEMATKRLSIEPGSVFCGTCIMGKGDLSTEANRPEGGAA